MRKAEFLDRFENHFESLLNCKNAVLSEAMRYAALSGGKRVRPVAVFLGADAIGDCEFSGLVSLASALELIHSYSLVHDDLPSMDNDDFRRGKLSTHKRYGEAVGVLCGDQLLTTAMMELSVNAGVYGQRYASAAAVIAQAARDMADGQAYDVAGTSDLDSYLKMCALKTAAMINAAFTCGAIYAGATDAEIENIAKYAKGVGLVFQLTDDLLDNGKNETSILTYETEKEAMKRIEDITETAVKAANNLPNSASLAEFAYELQSRTK